MELGLYDHHPLSPLSETAKAHYETLLSQALPLILEEKEGPEPVLSTLDEIEISLVDDPAIARLHRDFMNIEGATDVITFQHGEIIISSDTAAEQAKQYGESPERELFRYMIHGLLHLHGYLDYLPEDRENMFAIQEKLIGQLWPA